MKYYRLNAYDLNIIEECSEKQASKWKCRNIFRNYIKGYIVSTIFLGEDCAYYSTERTKEPILLFETMMFNPDGEILKNKRKYDLERFSTYKDASEYHNKCVENIIKKTKYKYISNSKSTFNCL